MPTSSPFSADLHGPWLLKEPAINLQPLVLHGARHEHAHIQSLRDDLLHPWANGNKLRKLDAYLPALIARGVTDILTCGGVQSAHCAALAALCAERGLRLHALLRGEQPAQVTGNLLVTLMYAHRVTYVERDLYADRARMFDRAVEALEEDERSALYVMPEGASNVLALKGFARLVQGLHDRLEHPNSPWTLLVDSGTGTSAAGLAAGIQAMRLPWRVRAVMLIKDARSTYEAQARELLVRAGHSEPDTRIDWVETVDRRRFGAIRADDILRCQEIAQKTGVMCDPVYTLKSYDYACAHALGPHTVFVHTGGSLNLFGAVSRKPGALGRRRR